MTKAFRISGGAFLAVALVVAALGAVLLFDAPMAAEEESSFRVAPAAMYQRTNSRVRPGEKILLELHAINQMQSDVMGLVRIDILDAQGNVVTALPADKAGDRRLIYGAVTRRGVTDPSAGEGRYWRPYWTVPADLPDGVYSARARVLAPDGRRVYAEAVTPRFALKGAAPPVETGQIIPRRPADAITPDTRIVTTLPVPVDTTSRVMPPDTGADVPIRATPDVAVTSVSAIPALPKAGQSATIRILSSNSGDAITGVTIRAYVDGVEVGSEVRSYGPPNQSDFPYTFPSAGSFQIKGVVSAPGDTNPSNNEMTVTVTVIAPAPDIVNDAVRAFKYNGQLNDSPVAGELASIQMDLGNGGDSNSGGFTTVYYVNGERIAAENHGDLPPGATHTTGVTYSFPSAGSYQVRAAATNVTSERNTENNSREITVTVVEDTMGDIPSPGDSVMTELPPPSGDWSSSGKYHESLNIGGPYALPITIEGEMIIKGSVDDGYIFLAKSPVTSGNDADAKPFVMLYLFPQGADGGMPNRILYPANRNDDYVAGPSGFTPRNSWFPVKLTVDRNGKVTGQAAGQTLSGNIDPANLTGEWYAHVGGYHDPRYGGPGVEARNWRVEGGSREMTAPDIVVERIEITPVEATVGQEVTITAVMKNIGDGPASGISTAGRIPQVAITATNADAVPEEPVFIIQVELPWTIAPGQTFSQSAKYRFVRAGAAMVEARYPLTPGELISENNVKSAPVTVTEAPPFGEWATTGSGPGERIYRSLGKVYAPAKITGEYYVLGNRNGCYLTFSKLSELNHENENSQDNVRALVRYAPWGSFTTWSLGGGVAAGTTNLGEQSWGVWVPFEFSLNEDGTISASPKGPAITQMDLDKIRAIKPDAAWNAFAIMSQNEGDPGAVKFRNLRLVGSTTPREPAKVTSIAPASMGMVTEGKTAFALSDVTATITGENLRSGMKVRLEVEGWDKPLEMTLGGAFSGAGRSTNPKLPFRWTAAGRAVVEAPGKAVIRFSDWGMAWGDPIFAVPVRLKGRWIFLDEEGRKIGEAPVDVEYLPYGEEFIGGAWD